MNLLIERGILLKPYAAPLDIATGKHRVPDGWTADRTPAMHARFNELEAEIPDETPGFVLWAQVEREEGERLAKFKRPCPGWVPVKQSERRIVKAYRELFIRMNPGSNGKARPGTKWPPDGRYVLRGATMERME